MRYRLLRSYCCNFHLFNISTVWDAYLCFTMIKLIFYGLVVYLIYKLVFELIIPVGKASSQMREKIKEMQENQNFQQQARPQAEPEKAPKPITDKDYIEFEEVKPK